MDLTNLHPARLALFSLAAFLLTPAVFADAVSESSGSVHSVTNAQKLAQSIASGEKFLAGLFDPTLDSKPE